MANTNTNEKVLNTEFAKLYIKFKDLKDSKSPSEKHSLTKAFDAYINDPSNENKLKAKIEYKKYNAKANISNFSEAINSLGFIKKFAAIGTIFLTGIIPGFVSSVKNYNSFEDYESLNVLEKSADSASNSLFGSTGPLMEFYLESIPFIEFLVSRKKRASNSHVDALKTLTFNCIFFLPLSIIFFERISKLDIFHENSKYALILQVFTSFLRSLVISTLLITSGLAVNFLLNGIENKIANHNKCPQKLHDDKKTDDNKSKLNWQSRLVFRTFISGILISLARYILPKLELSTISYLNSINAGSDLILFTQNVFSSTLMVFSIYCLWARLILFVARDALKEKFEKDQTNRFGVSKLILSSLGISLVLFITKNFIEKYTNQFFLKNDILQAILGFAIIADIIFCGLLFSSKQNELKQKIDNIKDQVELDNAKSILEKSASKKIYIASVISTISATLILYSFINEIENGFLKIATNFIQNPLILSFIVFGCISLIIQGVLENGVSKNLEEGVICKNLNVANIDKIFDLTNSVVEA